MMGHAHNCRNDTTIGMPLCLVFHDYGLSSGWYSSGDVLQCILLYTECDISRYAPFPQSVIFVLQRHHSLTLQFQVMQFVHYIFFVLLSICASNATAFQYHCTISMLPNLDSASDQVLAEPVLGLSNLCPLRDWVT